MSPPYDDGEIAEARVLPAVWELFGRLRERVLDEAERVSAKGAGVA